MTKINPYNFVSLPEGGPDRPRGYPGLLSIGKEAYHGMLHCHLITLGPLVSLDQRNATTETIHNGQGNTFTNRQGKPLQIRVFKFLRNGAGQPILQGTSLKGMIRSVYEAITSSCLPLSINQGEYRHRGGRTTYRYADFGAYAPGQCCTDKALCPACRLFGAVQGEELHCRGRVLCTDATLLQGQLDDQRRYYLKELSSPKPHHYPTYGQHPHQPGCAVRGRKFYYHHSPTPDFFVKTKREYQAFFEKMANTPQDFSRSIALDEIAPKDRKFEFQIYLDNLDPEELGLLLLTIELCDGLGHKFGLGKAIGMGSCRIEIDVTQSRLFKGGNRYYPEGPQKNDGWYALKKGPDHLPPELVEVLRLNKPEDETTSKIGYPDYRGYPTTPINARGFFSNQAQSPGAPTNWPPRDCLHQQAEKGTPTSPNPAPAVSETWERAVLTWTPGNQLITAVFQGRKATASGKKLAPEALHNSLFIKRQAIATVTVEPLGNAFRIVHIEAAICEEPCI